MLVQDPGRGRQERPRRWAHGHVSVSAPFAFPIVNFKKKAKVHPWGKERSVLFSNPLEEFPILIISEPSFFAGLVYFKTLSFTVF